DRANLLARGADRQRGRGVDDDVGPGAELARACRVADVAAELLDRPFELGIVEPREVERPHVVPLGEQPPGQVQPEEARAAAARPEHQRWTLAALVGCGAGCGGGLEST